MDRNWKIALGVIGVVTFWNGRLLKKVIAANNHNAEMINKLFANDQVWFQREVDREFEEIAERFDD